MLTAGRTLKENIILIIPHKIPATAPYFAPFLNEKKIKGTDCPSVTVPPKGNLSTDIKLKIVQSETTADISDISAIFELFI